MRVCAQASCHFLKFGFKLRPSTSATHRTFHSKFKCHLFKDWAVLVLAVIHCMHELMHQGIEYLNTIAKPWRNKDLIDLIGRGLCTPALADVAAFNVGAGKATGDMALGDDITFFFK